MQTTFLKYVNSAWTTQFVRDDMEQGNWTQEEYTVNMTFPYVSGKVIEHGMRVAFRDPATNNLEMFEIRNVTNIEPEHYQQIIGEHIVISELTDEHIDTKEITDKTAAQAVSTVLSGTLWSLGNNTASGTSSGDIGRGSVWQAIIAIQTNWNVYITPRVTLNSAGSITGRYLDVAPAQGTWRGVRLSIDKNMSDASVVYDDSEVLTAMYGYGGMIDVENEETYNTSEELDFSGVAWSATSSHPAKPLGQKYIEYPEKTALYGRNGRPRYGYYQNSDITNANTLLEKTWEALKATCDPKISITGTTSDLYRLGYKDEPLRLHDTVIVEIRQTRETFQKEIIKLDVDLLDPTASRPEIGAYIPNIIYINRDTNEYATTGEIGGRGGGGGGRGQSNTLKYEYDTYSGFEKQTDEYGSMIAMVVGKYDGNEYIKAGEIGLAINKTGDPTSPYETKAYINADHVNISATQTAYSLAGDMEHDANGKLVIKSAGGMYIQRTESGTTSQFGVFDNGNLTGGIIVDKVNNSTNTYITGTHVNISGTNTVQTIAGAMEVDANGNLVIKNGAGFRLRKTSGGSTAEFGVYDTNNLTAGVAVGIINGNTTLKISADRIDIDGIVEGLTAYDVEINSLDVNDIYCSTTVQSNSFSFEGGDLFTNCIVSADVSGNVLTLTDAYGDEVTFSKATTLTGDWSGSYQAGKKYVVIAKQNNVQVATDESPIVNSVAKYGSPSWSSGNATYDQQVLVQDSDSNSIYLGTIDVKNIYDSGYSNGYPSGTITIGSRITGSTYNVSISPTSGTAKATTKDFSSIYADARDGYTQGTFTLASVTLQGQRVTGTSYHTVETGGTVYYTAGTAVTRLGSSVTPTSVSGYRRGSSVSMSRDTIYRQGTGGVYKKIGYCYFCDSTAGASTMYKGGDYFNYHDVGTSSTLYYAGSSVTPISGGGLRLSTVTAYQAGSTVSDTYYTKS